MAWEAFSVFSASRNCPCEKGWGYKRLNKSDASESKHAKLLSRVNPVDIKIITIIFVLFFYFKYNLSLYFFYIRFIPKIHLREFSGFPLLYRTILCLVLSPFPKTVIPHILLAFKPRTVE